MKKINFEDGVTKGNATTFNQLEDNVEEGLNQLQKELNTLTENINKAKTITLNGKWMNAISSFGGDTKIRIPIFNPKNTQPTLIDFSGQFYDENTTGWKDVTNIIVGTYNTTYVELSMKTDVQKNGVLLKLYGTIQAE